MIISDSWGGDFAQVGTDQRNHETCLEEQMLGHDMHKPLLPKSGAGRGWGAGEGGAGVG